MASCELGSRIFYSKNYKFLFYLRKVLLEDSWYLKWFRFSFSKRCLNIPFKFEAQFKNSAAQILNSFSNCFKMNTYLLNSGLAIGRSVYRFLFNVWLLLLMINSLVKFIWLFTTWLWLCGRRPNVLNVLILFCANLWLFLFNVSPYLRENKVLL